MYEIKTTKEIKETTCYVQGMEFRNDHDNQKWISINSVNEIIKKIETENSAEGKKWSHVTTVIQIIKDELKTAHKSG